NAHIVTFLNSHVANKFDYNAWAESYLREIEYFRPQIDKKYIKSIFFGGGTPSLMDPDIVRQIISKLSMIGSIDQNTEITLEANPTSI
ncbi:MAG UNVERIFIED_CONTAM: coproporphyrinogen III oxidase, partial [Rickettsiaceae bacterium]